MDDPHWSPFALIPNALQDGLLEKRAGREYFSKTETAPIELLAELPFLVSGPSDMILGVLFSRAN